MTAATTAAASTTGNGPLAALTRRTPGRTGLARTVEVKDPGIGHQCDDLLRAEVDGVDWGCLQRLQRREGRIRRDPGSHRVLHRARVDEHPLTFLGW